MKTDEKEIIEGSWNKVREIAIMIDDCIALNDLPYKETFISLIFMARSILLANPEKEDLSLKFSDLALKGDLDYLLGPRTKLSNPPNDL